jgi:hypothetical protein
MGGSDGIGGGTAATAGPYAMGGTGTTRSPRTELDSFVIELGGGGVGRNVELDGSARGGEGGDGH